MTSTEGTTPVGDAARFYQSVWPLAGLVLRLAMMVNVDRGGAEELAYQTLLEAGRTIDQRGGADGRVWVLAILYKRRLEQMRTVEPAPADAAHRWQPAAGESKLPAGDLNQILALLSDEQIATVMWGMPEDLRWVVMLLDVAGIDAPHVAVILDVPVWKIDDHAKLAHAVLRGLLSPLATAVNANQRNQVFERR